MRPWRATPHQRGAPMMSNPSKLGALIDHWERSRELGQDLPAEELCRDCPELLEELRHKIHALMAAQWSDETVDHEDPGLLSLLRTDQADDDDHPRRTGPLTVEEFARALIASGLMSADELRDLQARLSPDEQSGDAQHFA